MNSQNFSELTRSIGNSREERIKAGLNPKDSQELIDLWLARKDGLTETQWQRLFVLVRYVLQRCSAPILAKLPENREFYIHDYFVRSVFDKATSAKPLEHVGVLVVYFKRFLIDQTRSADFRLAVSVDDMEEHERDHLECESGECAEAGSTEIDHLLYETGLDRDRVMASAGEFLASLDHGERAYLRHNTCADDPEAMSSIAKRMEIANYHEKARKLGITGLKTGFVAGYEQTHIGRWLTSLGIEVTLDWWPQLKSVMILLCLMVLSLPEEP